MGGLCARGQYELHGLPPDVGGSPICILIPMTQEFWWSHTSTEYLDRVVSLLPFPNRPVQCRNSKVYCFICQPQSTLYFFDAHSRCRLRPNSSPQPYG